MSCFTAVTGADNLHEIVVVGHRLPREQPQFHWVNTALGNLKTALAGTHHAFDFAKYAASDLAGFTFRFDRGIDRRAPTARIIVDIARCQPRARRVIRGNAETQCKSGESGASFTSGPGSA